ncbi:MAG: SLBB domain-containing protein [Saprospiraceae bacterium]
MTVNLKILITFLLLIFSKTVFFSQINNISEDQVRSELSKRGLTEDEVQKALIDNGIDPNSLENPTPEQIMQIQTIVEDLEKKKKAAQVQPEAKKTEITKTEEQIKDSIKTEIQESRIEAEEVKKISKIYGHELLNLPPKSKSDNIRVNDNYIMGPGDNISIAIWSNYAQLDNTYTIGDDGYIQFDRLYLRKRVYLSGLTYSTARTKIEQFLSQYMKFNKGEISIDLESSRNIKISIYGEVILPGSYDVDATQTVFEGIKYASGVTNIASVRNIKLIRANGKVQNFDLYKYISDPSVAYNFFLQDNDLIHIPVADKIVEIEGAVKRQLSFELIDNEGIEELLVYAGGYTSDAIKDKFQVERFVGDKKVYIDVDLKNTGENGRNFKLQNGDIVTVRKISAKAENFFTITGSVYNPGKFENKNGVKLSDAFNMAGLKPDTKMDFAFLIRYDDIKGNEYVKINIDTVLANIGNPMIDFTIKNKDEIIIWSNKRFSDDAYFEVTGAVRGDSKKYNYGINKSIDVAEAIVLAGGLSRNASDIAFIHRKDPLKGFDIQYIRINIKNVLEDPNSSDNIALEPFDNLEVLPENLFSENTFVHIYGAVNNPGEFQYGENMSLLDLVTMAGGFKLGASSNNIEVSRIVIQNNNPVKVIVSKLEMNKDIESFDSDVKSYLLEPYDNVYVRYIPDFSMQKIITIEGEVKYPGNYSLSSKNEKVSDIIQRAGGLTTEAFTEGATLYRNMDDTGYIIMRLEDAMKYNKSKYNYLLKDKDLITIPKIKDFVSIIGATKVYERYKAEIATSRTGVNVPYHKGKRAKYYIDGYAGGLDDNALKKDILVEYPNGEVKKSTNYGFFSVSPMVKKGSIIKVIPKLEKKNVDKDEKEVDWNKIVSDSVAQISTIMTLVILFKTLSQ